MFIYFFVYFFIKTSKTWGIFNYTFLSKIISGNLCLSFLYMLNNIHFPISFYKLVFRKKPHIGLQQLKGRRPASRKAQSVYDEPGKKLDLLFFIYFSRKWAGTYNKLHLWAKAMPLLAPFSPGILWKIDKKRH